ncbi:tetratricopeptide repeat protein [Luminiphilus sp.]|nr:tetratricopeptide repeat protein [Luminiphilus sp.]
MSIENSDVKTLKQLEGELEVAFRGGEVGETALLAWESKARFPSESGVASIYIKKLLRDPYVAGISLEDFKKNAKSLRDEDEPEELARLSALGLLRFPAQRYLSLSLLEAAERLGKTEWMEPVIRPLGEPEDGDVVLLNAVASLESFLGNYERALELFEKLTLQEPNNEKIIQNYSAALTGLKQYKKAINLLENHLPQSATPREYVHRLLPLYRLGGLDPEVELDQLDRNLFAKCLSIEAARVHTDLRLFLQDTEGVVFGLERVLQYKWKPEVAFELAEAELASGNIAAGLERYGVRFEAFPKLEWYKAQEKKYAGQYLTDEFLFVWGEQGIGDEIMFAMFLEVMVPRVKNMVIALDHRLIPVFEFKYPQWRFIDRHNLPSDFPEFDYACPLGDLMVLFLSGLLAEDQEFKQPVITPDATRYDEICQLLTKQERPRIAISWRGGGDNANGKIRSMLLSELMSGLPAANDVEVISLQYDENCEKEILMNGDRRVAFSGLNNRSDLEGVFALISCCDAVITVDNAVAHFAAALGVPVAVLIPAAQTQYRWKQSAIKQLLFPSARLFVQGKPGDWETAAKDAWRFALENAGNN